MIGSNEQAEQVSIPTPRKTIIGGQAVIEGVMMRGKNRYAMAVRKPDNSIEMVEDMLSPITDRVPFLKVPILRGIAALGGSMVLGFKIITKSAEIAFEGEDEMNQDAQLSKFEQFLTNIFGEKLNDVLVYMSVAVAMALSVGLFFMLPVWLGGFSTMIIGEHTWALGIIEGFIRISLLIGYMVLISKMKDVQRTFAYHGAEHKTLNCFESGLPLTVENVMQSTRLHRRCGTSFLVFVMVISFAIFTFVRTDIFWLRIVSRVVLVMPIAGLSYEVIRWAGKSESGFVKIVSAPGMLLQKITTQEPDEAQVEIAIAAMNKVLAYESES